MDAEARHDEEREQDELPTEPPAEEYQESEEDQTPISEPTLSDETASFVADGRRCTLSNNYVPAQIVESWIVTGVVSTILITFNLVAWWFEWLTGSWLVGVAFVAWGIFALVVWLGFRYPYWEFKYTRYAVTDACVVIHRGIFWKSTTTLPRSRIQHMDVDQGPLARRYAIATLRFFTAGTDHNEVKLDGLDYDTAVEIRNLLVGEAL